MPKHYLEIRTYPVVGNIYVNGVFWGRGHVKKLVEEGTYRIEFGYRKGYREPSPRYVEVRGRTYIPARYVKVYEVEIKRPSHFLEVDTSPVKGDIYIDGEYEGRAPIRRLVPEGKHRISFGYVENFKEPTPVEVEVLGTTRVVGTYTPIPREPEIEYFVAEPEEVSRGEKTTLSWSVKNAIAVALDGEPVPLVGKKEVVIEDTTTFTLTAMSVYELEQTSAVTVRVKEVWKRKLFVLASYDPRKRNIEAHFRATFLSSWDEEETEDDAEILIKEFLDASDYNIPVFSGQPVGMSNDKEFGEQEFSEEEVPKFYEFLIMDYDYNDTIRTRCKFETEYADWRENMDDMRENIRRFTTKPVGRRGRKRKG
ncbi:MAG: PEGA domain-containing protein [Candidatus Brockarchaeota archaeon]|nr:PEGA domain-containing protein [Candidatus Brockarchaeota archaeon]